MGSSTLVPLFINRFSLSPRTAVGVQTLRLLHPYEDWLHFHWWSSSLKPLNTRSVLLENAVLGRFSLLHHPGVVRMCERLGLSAWSGDTLRPSVARRLTSGYIERINGVYLAPLGEGDAQRCLKLADLVGAPFVLHLWDVLEGDVTRGALRELVDRAEHVFCVSHPLVRDVSAFRPDAELLLFWRDPALARARPRENGPLKIVIHGNVSSYAEGLDDLDGAISLLAKKGIAVEVWFLGSPKIMRQARTTIKKRVRIRGFLATQAELDTALSEAHVGFLPGPKLDPAVDLRSRYSIPSRIVDYMALGLPIVGTVHGRSATAEFARWLGLDSVLYTEPAQIAERLLSLLRPEYWYEQSKGSQQAFAMLQNVEPPALTLKRTMEKIV
jgi:glycosyltransferase involved in cell wall biosynthesis